MAEPVLLPVEIWCQIFPYMDEASIRNASAAWRLFFEIVRGSEKYSGHVILKQIDLSQIVIKIKSEEWTWQRWPCLKTLEIPIQLWRIRSYQIAKVRAMSKFRQNFDIQLRLQIVLWRHFI